MECTLSKHWLKFNETKMCCNEGYEITGKETLDTPIRLEAESLDIPLTNGKYLRITVSEWGTVSLIDNPLYSKPPKD